MPAMFHVNTECPKCHKCVNSGIKVKDPRTYAVTDAIYLPKTKTRCWACQAGVRLAETSPNHYGFQVDPDSPFPLEVGDVIEVHGHSALAKLDAGCYRILKIDRTKGTYTFCRPRGTKPVVTHYADNVDPWIRPHHDPDINKITVRKAS